MRFGIVVFPGSNCDRDCFHAVTRVLRQPASFLWHKGTDLARSDCVILPGGFSYGDYLRSGAMAAASPVMDSIRRFAADGGLVLGICNGFQILQEARLLPGALMRNASLRFICREAFVRVERADTPFSHACREGEVLSLPVAHMDGNFFLEGALLDQLESSRGVFVRYCDPAGNVLPEWNPNGSARAIAGVVNERGNVCGLMPHPERASEKLLGGEDGIKIFSSIIRWYEGEGR